MKEDEILEFNYKNPNAPKVDEWTKYKSYGGFPSDDANALQQLASGEFDWIGCYGSMFYQNETLLTRPSGVSIGRKHIHTVIEHVPVMKGTLTGTVHYNNVAIQTFVFSSAGACTMTKIGQSLGLVKTMEINWQTGQITSTWNVAVNMADIKLIVSYECER